MCMNQSTVVKLTRYAYSFLTTLTRESQLVTWWDLKYWSLVLEAIGLPTGPQQPLPQIFLNFVEHLLSNVRLESKPN